MTKRDYIKFAKMLASEQATARIGHTIHQCVIVEYIKVLIADIFAHDNPRFNREKFYRACEPKLGK